MQRLKLFLPLMVFVVIALVFFRLETRMISGDYVPSELPSAMLDKPLPNFSLPMLGDSSQQLTLTDLRKRPFLLNVWATWCISCRVEHPYLHKLAELGVPIYGLNYKDEESEALLWLKKLGDPYVLNINDSEGRLGLDLGVYGAPETYLIDVDGVIRYRHVGIVDDRVWETKLQPLMQSLQEKNNSANAPAAPEEKTSTASEVSR